MKLRFLVSFLGLWTLACGGMAEGPAPILPRAPQGSGVSEAAPPTAPPGPEASAAPVPEAPAAPVADLPHPAFDYGPAIPGAEIPGFPSHVRVSGATLYEGTLRHLSYDEADFPHGGARRRGERWSAYLVAGEPRPTPQQWASALHRQGWEVRHQGEQGETTMSRTDGSAELWLKFSLDPYQDPQITVLDPRGTSAAVRLPRPTASPEAIGDGQDFPYLPAMRGMTLDSTSHESQPVLINFPGDEAATVVAQGSISKMYAIDPTLSKFEFEAAYRPALADASWEVLPPETTDLGGEGKIVAHYAKEGRDIWAILGRGNDESPSSNVLAVADVGLEPWGKALLEDCKLTLTGVTFEFNKAALRPESSSALDRAALALSSNPGLAVEVQGHTDSVGDDPYNLDLSSRRAASVREALQTRGVAADRLTPRGYGEAVPVASNDTDVGRAQNRRVELVCKK